MEVFDGVITPKVSPLGVAHNGGTNSSAPISGVVLERVSPSMSDVMYDTTLALPSASKPST